jgi:hypothetical protein
MKYYLNPNNQQLYGYPADGSQDPFIPAEYQLQTAQQVAERLAPTPAEIEAKLSAQIQKRLDDFAHTRNYDGIQSACTYATSTVAKFKAEGQACVNLRDATWAAAYDILAQVQAGTRPMPQSIAGIEADLPALVWPA